MADEIKVTGILQVSNGLYDQRQQVANFSKDQTGNSMASGVVAIGASPEALPIAADVATAGYSLFRNLGSNTVTITVDIELEGGDFAIFQPASTSINAVAASGNSDLYYWVNEK